MTVRELVFATVAGDVTLNGLGFNADTVYANGAPDSPQDRRFAVLRWGPEIPALGGARGRVKPTDRDCSLWVYDRDNDYGAINSALKRWCEFMDALSAVKTGQGTYDGWVLETAWQGDTDDGWDDIYQANYRSSTYRIVASGD